MVSLDAFGFKRKVESPKGELICKSPKQRFKSPVDVSPFKCWCCPVSFKTSQGLQGHFTSHAHKKFVEDHETAARVAPFSFPIQSASSSSLKFAMTEEHYKRLPSVVANCVTLTYTDPGPTKKQAKRIPKNLKFTRGREKRRRHSDDKKLEVIMKIKI